MDDACERKRKKCTAASCSKCGSREGKWDAAINAWRCGSATCNAVLLICPGFEGEATTP